MKTKLRTAYILVLCFGFILISCRSGKNEKLIGLNINIHHDDFEYSVIRFTKTRQLISVDDTLITGNDFYIVHFKVVNNALRVGHKWDNSIGYLVDENGLSYENNKEYQATINKHNSFGLKNIYNTPHSSSDTTILVFELPPTVTKPFLMVRGGLLMGDVFDGARFRKIKVKLF